MPTIFKCQNQLFASLLLRCDLTFLSYVGGGWRGGGTLFTGLLTHHQQIHSIALTDLAKQVSTHLWCQCDPNKRSWILWSSKVTDTWGLKGRLDKQQQTKMKAVTPCHEFTLDTDISTTQSHILWEINCMLLIYTFKNILDFICCYIKDVKWS